MMGAHSTIEDCCIIISTRNRPERLEETLRHLHAKGLGEIPLWIYDDASDDRDAIQRAVKTWPKANLIRGEKQHGQASGRNVMLKACGKQFAICLDDDQYFLRLGNLFEYTTGKRPRDGWAVVRFQCRRKRDGYLDMPAQMVAGTISNFMGGCALFHVPSILKVGGYREFWKYGGEEGELALRLFSEGFSIRYEPEILVEHNHYDAPIERRNYREYDYLYARNTILLMTMNGPLWFGLPIGFARSLRWSLARRRNLLAKMQGTLAGLWLTFSLWRERKPIPVRTVVSWMKMGRAG